MKHFTILCGLFGAFVSIPVLASQCALPSQAIQQQQLYKVVQNTEKKPVNSVDITAPGLAIVSFGKPEQKVVVTFTFRCSLQEDGIESLRDNPVGFWVVSYSPRHK